ncbi:hypothetical protein ACWTQZ_25980, partial [Escherichia coli]
IKKKKHLITNIIGPNQDILPDHVRQQIRVYDSTSNDKQYECPCPLLLNFKNWVLDPIFNNPFIRASFLFNLGRCEKQPVHSDDPKLSQEVIVKPVS